MDKKDIEKFLNKFKEFNELLNDEDDSQEQIKIINEINDTLVNLDNGIGKKITTTDKLKIKVKKLNPDVKLPTIAKFGDAGSDIRAISILKETDEKITYGTGLCIEIPYGYVGLVFPRSSVRNYDLDLSNCVGVIDSGYRGEIEATFNKINLGVNLYEINDRVVQLIIIPIPKVEFYEVDELSESERGEGGFGHSGK